MVRVVIVLDTHALLWWALDPDKLSEKARHMVGGMERQGGFASSISIWELGIKTKRGKLVLRVAGSGGLRARSKRHSAPD